MEPFVNHVNTFVFKEKGWQRVYQVYILKLLIGQKYIIVLG